MNDRLADLGDDVPAWATGDDTDNTPTASNGGGDIELGRMSKPADTSWDEEDDFQSTPFQSTQNENENPNKQHLIQQQQQHESEEIMKKFFQHVEVIKATIDNVSQSTRRIKQMDEKAKLAVSEGEEKRMSKEIKALIQDTNVKAKQAKNILGLLRNENKKYEAEETVNTSDMRKRENLVNTLTRKFIDEMKEYQNVQQAYKVNIRKKAVQQIKYVKEDATPEEVEQIMRSDGGREELYQQSILQGGVNDTIKQTYTKVAGKYQDILALEQSVAELHQMFLDFALLTEQQGELIDQIEFNVKSAVDYVEDANVDVHDAIESSKKVRKKQCMIIGIVIVVIIVLLFSLGILP